MLILILCAATGRLIAISFETLNSQPACEVFLVSRSMTTITTRTYCILYYHNKPPAEANEQSSYANAKLTYQKL